MDHLEESIEEIKADDVAVSQLEESLIASILDAPENVSELLDHVQPVDMLSDINGAVFHAMSQLDIEGAPIDRATVEARLVRDNPGRAEVVADRLDYLTSEVAVVADLEGYAKIIHDAAIVRRAAQAGRNIVAASNEAGIDADNMMGAVEREIAALDEAEGGVKKGAITFADFLPEGWKELEKVNSGELLGYSTGLANVDDITQGARPGQLWITAARPAMGKSVMLLQQAISTARQGGRTIFVNYEMTNQETLLRILAQIASVDIGKLIKNELPADVMIDVHKKAKELAEMPLELHDSAPPTIEGLISYIRREHRKNPLGAVCIDYLQLLDVSAKTNSRVEVVSKISRSLKMIAQELGIVVYTASQLNRGLESRADKTPLMSDLRESGSLEQDANVILGLTRPAVYDPEMDPREAICVVMKNRGGRSGVTLPLVFIGEQTTFRVDFGRDEGTAAMGNSGGGHASSGWNTDSAF